MIGRLLQRSETISGLSLQTMKEWWPESNRATAGVNVTEEVALSSAAWFCAFDLVSNDIGSLGFFTYRRLTPRGREKATESPVYRITHDAPNPYMTAFDFYKLITLLAMTWGNAYAELQFKGRKPYALWPIHPSRVKAERKPSGEPFYTVHNDDNSVTMIPYDKMIHVKGFSKDGLTGIGLIGLAREAIGMSVSALEYGANFFANNAQPTILISVPDGTLGDEENAERLRKSWVAKHGGAKRGGVGFIEDSTRVDKLGLTNVDAQFIETVKNSVILCCQFTHVPPHMLMQMDRATFCLPAGSQVFTLRGPVPIESVIVGEPVWSYDGSNVVASVVKGKSASGSQKIKRIVSHGAVLRCSEGHRVLVRRQTLSPVHGRGGIVTTDDGRKWRKNWEELYVRADEITPGDKLVMPKGVPECGNWTLPDGSDGNIAIGETIGHHLGDGFHWKVSDCPGGIGFSHAKNESSAPHYAEAMEKAFPNRTDKYSRTSILEAPVKSKRRDATTTCLYSSAAYQKLEVLGVLGNAKTKRLPPWVFAMPREFRVAVLRGYLDSDGTVNKRGHASFVSVSRALIDDFRHLAIGLGYRVSNICKSQTTNSFGGNLHITYRFGIGSASDVLDIRSHKPEYIARSERAVSNKKGRNVLMYAAERKRRGLDCGSVRYLTITDIVDEPEELTYDLSVEGTQSFIADGVIVHNSNIEHQSIQYIQMALMRYIKAIEQEFTRKLLADEPDMFCEFNLTTLLRGDQKAEADTLHLMRQDGVISVDDWREIKNMNPLPDGIGDIYLNPQNMEPAEATKAKADNPQAGQDAPPLDPPEPDDDDNTDRSRMNAAFRELATDALKRLAKIESDKAARAAKKPETYRAWCDSFLSEHRSRVYADLSPIIAAYREAIGNPALPSMIDKAVDAHIAALRRYVTEADAEAILKIEHAADVIGVWME